MVKLTMNQQRKLSKHNSNYSSQQPSNNNNDSRPASIGETTSQSSTKSAKSNGSSLDSHGPIGVLSSNASTKKQQQSSSSSSTSSSLGKRGSQDSGHEAVAVGAGSTTSADNTNPANILNVAEMLLHGVADNEILDIWLRSIQCEEFVAKFIDAGYDMPTISRITPQDLTAIGVTEPSKRLKIISEIKKLNLQDGIPNFIPADLSHWLSLIRLDSYYYKSLCDQQVDTIEKLCQLTWEDFEELGISKLGHQKRFQLAIERVKELEAEAKCETKPLSEPIYDTNPTQILLLTAGSTSENHCSNGPIINKQSSTSELSSTGSGSMQSVYSAASTHYQPTYAPLNYSENSQQQQQQSIIVNQLANGHNQSASIYSQPPQPAPIIYQQPPPPLLNTMQPQQMSQQSHYQQHQPIIKQQPQQNNPIHGVPYQLLGQTMMNETNLKTNGTMITSQQNRQSMSQLPFSALAKLPKHQQQLLQQSSIYATLSRQPSRAKQPPPPVPIRTNSLKSNSLIDDANERLQQQQTATGPVFTSTQLLNNCHTTSTSSLFGTCARSTLNSTRPNNHQFNSQTMLTKNKSFSGNAHMVASRARFLNRASQQPPQLPPQFSTNTMSTNLPQQQQQQQNQMHISNSNQSSNIYGTTGSTNSQAPPAIHSNGSGQIVGDASVLADRNLNSTNNSSSTSNMFPPNMQPTSLKGYNNCSSSSNISQNPIDRGNATEIGSGSSQVVDMNNRSRFYHSDDFDLHSDTNSTKSLIMMPTSGPSPVTTPVEGRPMVAANTTSSDSPTTQDSGSSQTLYNSLSSGSNDRSLNMYNFSQAGDLAGQQQQQQRSSTTTASSCTLNDPNLTLDRHNPTFPSSMMVNNKTNGSSLINGSQQQQCSNATTGKDDDFPPPPSPLSLTDSDEHDLVSLQSDSNFTDLSHGLMTFRVGI